MSLFLLIALIGGCGFHLQSAVTAPAEMDRTYVDAVDKHSLFYRRLRRNLTAVGVEIVDSPADATATLSILSDVTGQRVLSVSARNVPTEYEVYYTIQYALVAGERYLLETQQLTITRDYTYDETLVLGKAQEEQLLRDAIVDDLARIVMKQISTL